MKMQGPVEVEIKVYIINDDGMGGVATIGMGKSVFPTESDLRGRLSKFAEDEIPNGFRLMTKEEYWDCIAPRSVESDEDGNLCESKYALPGGREWDL